MSPFDYDCRRRLEGIRASLGVRLSTLDGMRRQGLDQAGAGDADATARSRLVAIVIERGDLFADATAGEAFCAVETDGGAVRTYKVASAAFTDWLLGVYGERYAETIDGRQVPGTVNASTRADAVRAIEAIARRGETREVFLRVGSGGEPDLHRHGDARAARDRGRPGRVVDRRRPARASRAQRHGQAPARARPQPCRDAGWSGAWPGSSVSVRPTTASCSCSAS